MFVLYSFIFKSFYTVVLEVGYTAEKFSVLAIWTVKLAENWN